MTGDDRDRIAWLMHRMAHGDELAPFVLYGEFGALLAAVMRRHLGAVGVPRATRAEVDGLVIDACLELASCAAAWRADGGALPWTWAGRRLRALAVGFAGIHADQLDPETLDEHSFDSRAADRAIPAPGGADPSAYEALVALAEGRPMAALLLDALDRVGTPRDQRIVLELTLQADLGDPSPARTVGAELAVAPEAVRKVGSRMRRRLRDLAATDERFAPLAELPLVA